MKKTVAVVFGGTNTEHEVSIVSARSVINHLDADKFTVVPIYISKNNQWSYDWNISSKNLPKLSSKTEWLRNAWKIPTIDPVELLKGKRIQVVFPVLHGPYGEDGTLQGMMEMLRLPYVGCNVLASALCMDKVVQKQLCIQQGLPVAPFAFTTKHQWENSQQQVLSYIQNKLQYPLFVKPANQGSSVGVVKVHQESELIPAITEAFRYDTKAVIEQGVDHAREIECAVLGNDNPTASVLGEILPSNEFYDYDSKYVDGKSNAIIPAKLPKPVADKIQTIALRAYTILNCSGLARVDFLVNGKTHEIFLNELNTMPGFTHISMYPKLWEASGTTYEQLLEKLIDFALERHAEQSQRVLTYQPKLPWHRQ